MSPRNLFILLALMAATVFGQPLAPVKAGDPAPNLRWTKIIASSSASSGPQSLFGQTTVLLFLRPVSHNQQAVEAWNALVQHFLVQDFTGKAVNFIWIATEDEKSLAPWLKAHPIEGWLVLDPSEESFKAYGVDGTAGVFIDPHGIISGFSMMTPQEDQIQAAMDGRTIAVGGDSTVEQMDAIFAGKLVRLEAQPFRSPFPAPIERPYLPPPEEVYISPTHTEGTVDSCGPDFRVLRGFDLKTAIAKVSTADPTRVELAPELNSNSKYDFVLALPRQEEPETMNRLVRQGIENYFHVSITPEIRSTDVYVLTAVPGKTPPRKSEDGAFGGSVAFSSNWNSISLPEATAPTREALETAARDSMATAQLTGMVAFSSSVDDLRRALEDGLHRPVLDETGLNGFYDFKVRGEARTTEQFLGMLQDQLGLVLTPARRGIEMTVARLAR